jgi:hypothetical protein
MEGRRVKKYQATPAAKDDWQDLRDKRGKLCARIDTKRLLLEIKRSDRGIVATFDLRVYLVIEDKQTKEEG